MIGEREFMAAVEYSRHQLRSRARGIVWHRGDYDVDDLVQEGITAAWAARHRFDPARGASLSTWLINRATGAMRDLRRRMAQPWEPRRARDRELAAGRSRVTEAELGSVAVVDHGGRLERFMLDTALRHRIESRLARILELHYVDELSFAEIAAELGGAVWYLHRDAVAELRQAFAEWRPVLEVAA